MPSPNSNGLPVNTALKQCLDRLDRCQSRDRHAIKKRIDKASRMGEIDQAEIANIADLLEQSESLVAEKTALALQPIHYPDLPVTAAKQELLETLRDNQVVVVAGETGSGKTTQLPKLCLELGLGCRGLIGHTQPRRLAARTVASRIADELKTPLGERVGYQVRFHDQVGPSTQIKLMTDGILLAETQHDPYLNHYEVIIIDEAHERSLNIDFLLGYFKRILPKRPDLKLIITSATIDVGRFSKHFNDAPVIEVSGRTFPVETLYRPLNESSEGDSDASGDIQHGILQAVDELVAIDRAKSGSMPGDILVFLPGEREIRDTAETLRKADLRDTEIMPLYARLSLAEQNKVFTSGRSAGRRIVLATNVAETSVTVPGIRYVIDPGLVRMSRYSYRSKVQRLPIEPVSQASANQRAGRCGRVAPGTCIRLYSQDDFTGRPEFTDAEIRRTNLASVILQMLQLRLGDISKFPFIDPPDKRFINDGYKLLEELQAVDAKRHLTPLGKQLARLPVDPRIARIIVEGHRQHALKEILIVTSALSNQDPRERPQNKRQAADEKHRLFQDDKSDFISLVNLWNAFEEQRLELSQNQLRKWCTKHYLSYIRMREWRDLHRQLHLSIKSLQLKENPEPASYDQVHRALISGFLGHLGFKQERGEYLGARNRRFKIFPGSGVFKKAPKWLVAAEMIETSQLFAHMVAEIDPEWVEPLAKHLVKRSHLEPHWEKKRAQVVAIEQVRLYGLMIVAKRKVHYGPIDAQISHEIFIRSALVEGEFHTKGAFFEHNRQLLASVAALEDKSRRRDLLVDEETLYQFYSERLSEHEGAHVVNGAGFESWRKQVEQRSPKALFLEESDVLQRSAEHVREEQYPEQLLIDGAPLSLSYKFEIGAQDDGLSIDCPLPLLPRLSTERLHWLVPGMLAAKLEALLRGLPKTERKRFVPIPNYVEALLDKLSFAEGNLFEAISLQLLRMTGYRLNVDRLAEVKLEPLHLANIRVLDEQGAVLDQGRDWSVLQRTLGDAAQSAIQQAPKQNWGKTELTEWSFGQLEERKVVKHAGGIEVEAFPALVDHGDTVELTLMNQPLDAQRASHRGVARLVLLSLQPQVKEIRKALPNLAQAILQAGKKYNERYLQDQIILAAALSLIDEHVLPRTESDYDHLRDHVRGLLHHRSLELAGFVSDLHKRVHRITKTLNGKVLLETVPVLNDIRAQVDRLVDKRYLTETPPNWLLHLPRYLNAIEVRLDKYQRNLRQHVLWSDELSRWQQQYDAAIAKARDTSAVSSDLIDFKWWIEEYRVSLFAQELGTEFKISEKRLKQRFTQVSG